MAAQVEQGVSQYLILGAGLDTFVQRRPELASGLRVFEVDQPGPQAWKRQRLIELGFGIPPWLRLVPVDFEAGQLWWKSLGDAGFEAGQATIDGRHRPPDVPHPGGDFHRHCAMSQRSRQVPRWP